MPPASTDCIALRIIEPFKDCREFILWPFPIGFVRATARKCSWCSSTGNSIRETTCGAATIVPKYRGYSLMVDPDLPTLRGETNLTVTDVATSSTEAEKIIDSNRLTIRGAEVGATPISP